jgi:hypothetical protein
MHHNIKHLNNMNIFKGKIKSLVISMENSIFLLSNLQKTEELIYFYRTSFMDTWRAKSNCLHICHFTYRLSKDACT